MYKEQELRAAVKGGIPDRLCGANECRQSTPREMLMGKAEELRREAHALEALAMALPDGVFTPEVERTLTGCIAARIYR